MKNQATTIISRLIHNLNTLIIFFTFAILSSQTHAADLLGLWNGTAHFVQDKIYSSEMAQGHKEGFAVARPDVILNGGPTVFLYYRCYEYGSPQICLGIYDKTAKTLIQNKGSVISPTNGVFSVAPSVAKINGVWTMVYEEGGTSDGIYWATSSDGIVWTKKGSLFGGLTYRATPSLYSYQGVNYVFYAQKLDSNRLGITFHSGPSMTQMVQYGGGYVLSGSQPWDTASVSMPRLVLQGQYHWLFYEGASVNLNCGTSNSNLYGWGIARSTDLVHWEKWTKNPIMRHDATYNSESCGNDMPQPFIDPNTGNTHVFYTSNDTNYLIKDILVDGNACGSSMQYPNWKEINHQCTASCGNMGGTLCYQTKSCGSGSRLGMSYDCGSCCR